MPQKQDGCAWWRAAVPWFEFAKGPRCRALGVHYCKVAGIVMDWFSAPDTALTVTVKLPVMACSSTSEVTLDEFSLSPEYEAVMAWVPTVSEEVVRVATPRTGVTELPRMVFPS